MKVEKHESPPTTNMFDNIYLLNNISSYINKINNTYRKQLKLILLKFESETF